MDYQALTPVVAEILAEHPDWTDAQIATAMNVENRVKLRMRFGSYRTLGSVLNSAEYGTLKQVLAVAASTDVRVADMVKMLEQPGDDQGNGGGLDFGDLLTRNEMDNIVAGVPEGPTRDYVASIVAKVKALGEVSCSRAAELGLPTIDPAHVASARSLING
jgi:hypothetical protein